MVEEEAHAEEGEAFDALYGDGAILSVPDHRSSIDIDDDRAGRRPRFGGG
jgi:hypothetical protein